MQGLLTSRAAAFSVAGLMALTLVGSGSWFWGQRTGASHAVWDARADARTLATRISGANVIGGLIAGKPAAIQTVDRLVSEHGEKVVGVTLSSVDGHAVYSKNPAVLGTTTPLGETALQALQTGRPSVEVWTSPEASDIPVLRIHQPAEPPGGEALLLQADYDYRAVTAEGGEVWRMFAPVTLGALLLLGIVWLCLGWLALRRPRTAVAPFEAASHAELTPQPHAASGTLRAPEPAPAVAAQVEPQPPAPPMQPDRDGWLGELRGGNPWPAGPFTNPVPEGEVPLPGALRAGPPEPPRPLEEPLSPFAVPQPAPTAHANANGGSRGNGKPRSLETALSGMLLPLAQRGVDTRLDLPPGLRLPNDTEELLLRTAEEAVRNTMTHGQAHRVKVRLDVHDHRVELTVDDDGRGLDPDELIRPSPSGQVSLRTLTQLAANAGGALRVRSAPDRGTRLHLDLPTG